MAQKPKDILNLDNTVSIPVPVEAARRIVDIEMPLPSVGRSDYVETIGYPQEHPIGFLRHIGRLEKWDKRDLVRGQTKVDPLKDWKKIDRFLYPIYEDFLRSEGQDEWKNPLTSLRYIDEGNDEVSAVDKDLQEAYVAYLQSLRESHSAIEGKKDPFAKVREQMARRPLASHHTATPSSDPSRRSLRKPPVDA